MQNENATKKPSRFAKLIFSSGTSIILKIATFLCTFILTNLIISTYGSETNGLLNSITQFLGFITLLECGIGGVARAVLYKPLSEKNNEQISKIICQVERFFKVIAYIFVGYSIALAIVFPFLSDNFDYFFVFSLVFIISISTFCEYFFGISYSILLNSDQKGYIVNIATFATSILSFAFSIILVLLGCDIRFVKLVTALILILKPIFLSIYCKKRYKLAKNCLAKGENMIPQKWSGLGVHIAYYLHRNTDIFLITLFVSLTSVSVYSVYNMVISGILTIIEALCLGFEATFGDMYANKEYDNLKTKFKMFTFYHQSLSTFFLSCTVILLIPFVKIYTAEFNDANYVLPIFSTLFVTAEFFYCLRVPYNDLMVATNSFKKIQLGAYLEAGINIAISGVLVFFLGLEGVAIGTICAMIFRLIHFLIFFKKHELHMDIGWFIKGFLPFFIVFAISIAASFLLNIVAESYLMWVMYGFVVSACVLVAILVANLILNRKMLFDVFKYIKRRIFKK